jgi:ABC-type glycerol-3-phosphate transport system permease component
MAASTLTVLPPLLLLIFFGRRLVDAVGFTGVK